ncbi:MAG TPA: SDR family NAD(P)-dependent oxidoreductase [Blastocatellia bacterium]|nr:SDR family NAD(P)-dependent oxidoreductase [Blastocatellia bacterium]
MDFLVVDYILKETLKDVKGKVAFITGGASGIGLGMAKVFARNGMKVVIADIRQDHLVEAMNSFATGESVHGIRLDVTDREAMSRAASETERVFGKVHVLCNNAGIGLGGPMKLATYDDWDWIMEVNVGGVINGIQTFLPRILSHGEGGHIVNTSSMSGIFPAPGAGLYITTKFAVVGLSEALRSELAADDIGVSAFCPGPIATNIAESGVTRPTRFARTGYGETDKARARFDTSVFMDPIESGERVLRGIQRNDLYIFTHPEFRDGIKSRCDAIMAAIPDEDADPARVAQIGFLLSNPIFQQRS